MQYLTWLIPQKLATRPGPRACEWDLEALKNLGVSLVVSVSDEGERAAVKRAGLRHVTHYVPDMPLYTDEERHDFIKRVMGAVEAIHAEIQGGGCALVHCYAGRDRSGFVAAAYLTKYGMPDGRRFKAREALAYMRSFKPYCVFEGFDRALELYEKSYA